MARKMKPDDDTGEKYMLQLYIAGMTSKSIEAIENIKRFCVSYLSDAFELEIIDIYKNPEVACQQQIIFSPSLIKISPLPKRTLVGTFSDTKKVMKALGIVSEEL